MKLTTFIRLVKQFRSVATLPLRTSGGSFYHRLVVQSLVIGLALLLTAACAGNREGQLQRQRNEMRLQMAIELYWNAALYEFDGQYQRALAVYQQALRFDSTSSEIHKAIGKSYLQLGQNQKAIVALQKAVNINPDDPESLYWLAETYFRREDWHSAMQYYQAFYHLKPGHSEVQQQLILLYSRLGEAEKLLQMRKALAAQLGDASFDQLFSLYIRTADFQNASQLVLERLDETPDRPDVWLKLATVQEKQQDTLSALQSYRRVLELDPASQVAVKQIYFLYASRGDWSGLAGEMQHLITQDSLLYLARLYLAEAFLSSGDPPSARSWLKPLLKLPQYQHQALQAMVNVAIAQEQSGEAIRLLQQLVEIDDQNVQHPVMMARLLLSRGEAEKAENALLQAVERFPRQPEILTLMGDALQQQQKYALALPYLEKSKELRPDDLGNLVSLGIVYDALRRYTDSDVLYRHALREYPGHPLLLNNYAFSLAEQRIDLGIALHMALAALQNDPASSIYLDTVAWVLYQSGRYGEAREYALKAVAGTGAGPEAWEHLGDIEHARGNTSQARSAWQKALQMLPQNLSLQKKLAETDDKR